MKSWRRLLVPVLLGGMLSTTQVCSDGNKPSPTAPTVETAGGTPAPAPAPTPTPAPSPGSSRRGIWISRDELQREPEAGPPWDNLQAAARRTCGIPNLSNQEDPTNVCVLAKALLFARTGDAARRLEVVSALRVVAAASYSGRALALGRELAAYVIAADLIDLPTFDPALDAAFRVTIAGLLTTPTSDGPANLIDCHERRPNNWGMHCGASRLAVAAYLGDRAQVDRVATIFRGWLGDRSAYDGFQYGDLSWQCNPGRPVGINPRGCTRDGHSLDGVLPDDQRRAGGFTWPPPKENYVYEALQGALVQAVILQRLGYDAFNWQDRALLRAFQWLTNEANFPATGDDGWEVPLVNAFYRAGFPVQTPTRSGKNMGFTDFTHQ
jgi:hypothetical protein